MTVAQANPQLQTIKRQLPQSTEQYNQGAPFIRNVKKMSTFGFTFTATGTGSQTVTPQLPAVPGFLRFLSLEVSVTGGTGTTATYQADAPFSAISSVLVKDINNSTIFQVSGFELYLINLFSGQCGDSGTQNPTCVPSYSAPTTAGNFTYRLLIPFELNRAGYCCLAGASQATPMQVQIVANALTSSGQVYNAAPGGTPVINLKIQQFFWGLNQGSIESVHPDDLGASHQWTTAASGASITTSATTLAIAPTVAGYLSTLICVLRDATTSPGPARIGSLPTSDLSFRLDGVDVYSRQLLDDLQDKITRNFGLILNTNGTPADPSQPLGASTATPGTILGKGVIVYTFRDDVAETVLAADTLDELVKVGPGTRMEVQGTWGTVSTGPAVLSYTFGVLVPTDNYGLPYTHLGY